MISLDELVERQIFLGVSPRIEDGEPCFVRLGEGVGLAVVVDFGHGVQVVVVVHILIG